MPLLPGPLQGIFQPGPKPVGGVRLHPAVAGDGVCGLKADPLHIVDEPVGIFFDLGQAKLPIYFIQLHGLADGNPIFLQAQHDIP